MPIPVLQSLAFTSSTYFVVALARFDINAEVFFLPRLATTSAPSVSEILSSGQNYTCQGGVTCRSVIRGLQALTQYDIYYWFRSEDGAEPLTPVSTMMRRVSTIDVIPYDLTVVNVGADYNMITVIVSNEQRGGYVWCRASEVDTVPTVAELKATQSIVIEEGAEQGVKVIPNLLPGRTYYGYCYAEDFYGDVAANSIASTRFEVQTLLEEPAWSFAMNSTVNSVTADITINRDGEMCCRLDDEDEQCADVVSNVLTSLNMTAEDDREYLVQCTMHTSSLLDIVLTNETSVIRTPSRPPLFTFYSPVPLYNGALIPLDSDRSAYMWCLPIDPSEVLMPSVPEMKTGQRFTIIRDVRNELQVTGLQPETRYTIWCYGETFEGLAMQNAREELRWDVTTNPTPPTLSVNLTAITAHSITVEVTPSLPSTVRCIVLSPEDPVPTSGSFSDAEGVFVDTIGEVVVEGLSEDTSYASYCMAWDALNQTMITPVNSTRILFRTPLDLHSIYVTFVTTQQLTATISIVSSADCTAWCLPVHVNDVIPTASVLKASGKSVAMERLTPVQLTLDSLEPDYDYAVYCYSETDLGLGQSNSIQSTRVTFVSLNYPVISVDAASISYNRVDLDLTSSTNGTIFCRTRVQEANNLPPTEEWIEAGDRVDILTPFIVNYHTISGLQPDTVYQLYCLGRNGEGLSSLQSLSNRTLVVTTSADVSSPSVFLSTTPDEYSIDHQPVNVTIRFSEPVQSFDVGDLQLQNCRILSSQQYTNQITYLWVAPLTYGTYTITVPAGIVMDLVGNENSQQILSRVYPEGVLDSSLQSVEPMRAVLEVRYTYSANITCVATRSAVAPGSCAELRQMSDAETLSVVGGEPGELSLYGIAVNSTFYGYCCAEEANDITSGSLQSTQVLIEVGWLDCPRNGSLVCSGHGVCSDGLSCACENGYYGDSCEASCPGVLPFNSSMVECRGHGVCEVDTFTCVCDAGFEGPECVVRSLNSSVPSEGYRFVYVTLDAIVPEVIDSEYENQENQLLLLRTLAAQFSLAQEDVRVESWEYRSDARRLADEGSLEMTCVMNVAEGESESVRAYFSDGESLQQLSRELDSNGFSNSDLSVTGLVVVSPSQTDPYTCYDGSLSGDESDVDCGGSCLQKCQQNQRCVSDNDCASGLCEEMQCRRQMWETGWIVAVVIIVVFIVLIVVLFVFVVCTRKRERKELKKQKKEIEMIRQKKEQQFADLEKQDQMEEEALRQLEEKVNNRLHGANTSSRGEGSGSSEHGREERNIEMPPVNPESSVTENATNNADNALPNTEGPNPPSN